MATSPSSARAAADPMLHTLMGMLVASVASDGPDLTARQLAVFLKVYLEPNIDHTVRGLAAVLNVSKPAITRTLDPTNGDTWTPPCSMPSPTLYRPAKEMSEHWRRPTSCPAPSSTAR